MASGPRVSAALAALVLGGGLCAAAANPAARTRVVPALGQGVPLPIGGPPW